MYTSSKKKKTLKKEKRNMENKTSGCVNGAFYICRLKSFGKGLFKKMSLQ